MAALDRRREVPSETGVNGIAGVDPRGLSEGNKTAKPMINAKNG
jgi:hypothetical protein